MALCLDRAEGAGLSASAGATALHIFSFPPGFTSLDFLHSFLFFNTLKLIEPGQVIEKNWNEVSFLVFSLHKVAFFTLMVLRVVTCYSKIDCLVLLPHNTHDISNFVLLLFCQAGRSYACVDFVVHSGSFGIDSFPTPKT